MLFQDYLEELEITQHEIEFIVVDLFKLLLVKLFEAPLEDFLEAELVGQIQQVKNVMYLDFGADLLLQSLQQALCFEKIEYLRQLHQLIPGLQAQIHSVVVLKHSL